MKPFWDFSGTRGGKGGETRIAKTGKMQGGGGQKLKKESENSRWHLPYHFFPTLEWQQPSRRSRCSSVCSAQMGAREVKVLRVSQTQRGAGEGEALGPDLLTFFPCKLCMN